ncbi:MAG: PaaI family thioesterase [Planctomycetaceae bacterium]|nr:PaaI family thioesterase [Planctomycetaceae bacterium]
MPTNSASSQLVASWPLGPFLEGLRAEPVSFKKGHATWRLTVAEQHLRTHGILHGGVVATLLDTAMGRAVSTLCREDQSAVTAQLNVNFLRPSWSGETLTITGEVQHSGRQTAVARGEIRTSAGVLVATGSGTFMFVARPVEGQPLFVQHPDNSLPQQASS